MAWLVDEKFQHAMAKFRNAAYEITTNGSVPTKVDDSTGSCTVAFDHSIRNIAMNLRTKISFGQKKSLWTWLRTRFRFFSRRAFASFHLHETHSVG